MKIGIVAASDPFHDRKAWSGLIYKLREAIELAGFEVVWISYDPSVKFISWKEKLNDYYWKIRKILFHKDILGGVHCVINARKFAQSIDKEKISGCSYLFFPGGAQIGIYLKTSVPIIYLADATVYQMVDYYWFNIDKSAIREAKSLEKRASQKSFINIRASQWAVDSTINDCQVDKNKCYVLEFGANIDSKNITPNPVYERGRLNVLFSGVDWERKGGEIAVEIVGILREKGLDAHLLIVGPKVIPQQYNRAEYIEYYGFLDKNNSEDYKKYIQLYKRSHLFLLPTKAECAGVVFSEASGYGLPSYTYDTGGTTNYVINGKNGFAFPLGSSPEVFANKILNDVKSGVLKTYHNNALSLYKCQLSWEAWSLRFREIMSKY